jgi:hypothetical protein
MLISLLLAWPFYILSDLRSGTPILADPDFLLHLRNAQMLISSHHFPWQDVYSFTVFGHSWIDPEWLAELLYYLGFYMFGERGLFLVMLVAIELIVAGVFLRCCRRSEDVNAAFLATIFFVLTAIVNMGFRTILFGWLCLIAELLLLDAFRRNRDHLWLLVPLFALWINLHGSWLFGIVIYVLFMASGLVGGSWGSIAAVRWLPQQRRKLIAAGAGSIAALFFNPYGWRLVAYPFALMFRQQQMVSSVQEWASLDFHSAIGKICMIVFAGMVVLMLARPRTWQLHEVLFALFAIYAAMTHTRFLFLAGIVVCPLLAVELVGVLFAPYDLNRDAGVSRTSAIIAGCNAVIMAAGLVFALLHIPSSSVLRAAEAHYYPVQALPALETSCAQRRVFNDPNWGGYLIWNARDIPVFMDTRIDIFDFDGVFPDALNALRMKDSLAILDRYRIGCVFLKPDAPLVYLLRNTSGWRVQYQDASASLLVRTASGAENSSLPGQRGQEPVSP